MHPVVTPKTISARWLVKVTACLQYYWVPPPRDRNDIIVGWLYTWFGCMVDRSRLMWRWTVLICFSWKDCKKTHSLQTLLCDTTSPDKNHYKTDTYKKRKWYYFQNISWSIRFVDIVTTGAFCSYAIVYCYLEFKLSYLKTWNCFQLE